MAKSNNRTTMADNTQPYGSDLESSRSSGLRDRAADVGETASRQIDNSPLIALGAGVALGAALGAMLPASRKERELLGPVGTKLSDAGYGAVDRARDMGKQKFDELAGDKLREFLGASSGSSANNG